MQFMHNLLRCLLKKSDDVGPIDITKRGADVESAPLGYVVSKSIVYFTSSKSASWISSGFGPCWACC